MLKYRPGMLVEAPCYISGMPADIYHAHDSISNSGLKFVARSPAHFKHRPERKETRNKVLGSALHMAVLEPDEYDYVHTNEPDRRSKAYKDIAANYGGDKVLTLDESKHIEGIRDSLWSKYGELLSQPGRNELSGFVADPETGVMCRHRFDKLTNMCIAIDLKTCIDARTDAFSRAINNYGYHVQASFYMDQYEWITGEQLTDFLFFAVESDSPYAAKMYRLSEESIHIGRDIYRKSLNLYASCRESGVWLAYDNEVEEISIPQYAIYQHEQGQLDNFNFTEE